MSISREEFKKKWIAARQKGPEAEADLIFGVVTDDAQPSEEEATTNPNQLELPLKKD